jgi:hypothetical protein
MSLRIGIIAKMEFLQSRKLTMSLRYLYRVGHFPQKMTVSRHGGR